MKKPYNYKRQFGYKYSHFGSDTYGHDVKAFGDTTGKYLLWDASADTLILVGTLTMTGNPTITGNTQLTGTLTVGVDDTGHDVKFFGATTGKYFLWDESDDKLIVVGTADLGTSCEADAYTVGGVAGADFNGAVTNLTVVKGIVTAAS
jgi:hypothetical protein